jgi:glycosyltransferase involved in cell wall biosynthesis
LKSLQKQSRKPNEIIVVDNGSLDGTGDVARSFGVTVLEFPRPDIRHGTIGLVRQKGVEYSKGDVVVSTDADCVYPADWLEKIERHFTVNPRLAVLGGPVFNSNRSGWGDFLAGVGNFNRSYWAGWGIPYFLGGNTSFRREAFMLSDGYRGAGGHGPLEEWVLSFRLSRIGEWAWDDDLVCYTVVPQALLDDIALKIGSLVPVVAWTAVAVVQL